MAAPVLRASGRPNRCWRVRLNLIAVPEDHCERAAWRSLLGAAGLTEQLDSGDLLLVSAGERECRRRHFDLTASRRLLRHVASLRVDAGFSNRSNEPISDLEDRKHAPAALTLATIVQLANALDVAVGALLTAPGSGSGPGGVEAEARTEEAAESSAPAAEKVPSAK
jgi:hypothetical protein